MAEKERELQFGPGLFWPSLTWKKGATIRRYRPEAHDFRKGERVIGVFKEDFGEIRVPIIITRDTVTKPFRGVTDEEAQASGFDHVAGAFLELHRFYADLELNNTAAIIHYRPADKDVGARLLNFVRRVRNTCEIEGIDLDECRDPDEVREMKKARHMKQPRHSR